MFSDAGENRTSAEFSGPGMDTMTWQDLDGENEGVMSAWMKNDR